MRRLPVAPAVAVALVLALAVGAAPATPSGSAGSSTGSFGLRLVPAPGPAPANPLARLYVIDTMASGTSVTRSVDVLNGTASALDVAVYAAAVVVHGQFEIAPGRSADELSRWTSVQQDVVHVDPGASVVDTFTITVPTGAPSGDRTAVLWAEVRSAGSGPSGVTLVNRVGVRLYVTVGAGGPVSADFVVGPITASRSGAGAPTVEADVRNVSTSAFDVSGTLTLTDGPGGLGAGPFAVTAGSVLSPGASSKVTVPFGRAFPPGPWRAHLALTNGIIERSASATITFPTPVPPARGPGRIALFVVIVLLSLILAGMMAWLVAARRRRRHDGRGS